MADGSIASMCASRISMVPTLAAAVSAVGFDGPDHHLDCEHHPDLLRLAFAHAGPSVAGSGMDHGCWNMEPWLWLLRLSDCGDCTTGRAARSTEYGLVNGIDAHTFR